MAIAGIAGRSGSQGKVIATIAMIYELVI